MSPSIRIDEDVYEHLKNHAEPFVDTPNSVLRRILGLEAENPAPTEILQGVGDRTFGARKRRGRRGSRTRTRQKGSRAPSGSLLPEDEYFKPILDVLLKRGGSAPAREVIDSVGARLADLFKEADKAPIPSGGIRWQNRVQFARLRLVEEGLLSKDSQRGVWELTEAGRSRAAEAVNA